ncbi:protoheme IX farnesyltransferase, mitochondrial isoform X4 [Poecile atricapillus]|uniref:protoheme IX farnesyltransferase, mitochondrial isoform X4 n=1 Tax=Poecile atricapillus TaxID=48891 RepID=UPI002739CD37|nr:protoheme IX farnesyltransferase, mitochondrial isoform X4 [Poecile atricapillus]
MSAARRCCLLRALAGFFVWRLRNTGIPQIPCRFVHLHRVANDRLITFQYFNFLKRMYVTQCNKDLSQRAKPKSDSIVSPFRELQQLDQEKKVVYKISPVSPVHQSWSETSSRNELREVKSAAETEDSVIPVGGESREDRRWKEMKVQLDDLPGILARLSKIKLTALVVSTASAGFAMAPVPFELTCFLFTSLGTGLASCAANSINQPPARCLLCCLLRNPRNCPAHTGSELSHRGPGSLQHLPLHVLLHAPEENEHCQHVGGSCCWGHSPHHGLDCSYRESGCWCITVRRDPLLLAVPSLQCPELGSAGRVLPRRILYDVCHSPRAVQAGGSASLLRLNWTLNSGSCPRHHHMDFPHHFTSHQPLHLLPWLSVLQGC